MNLEKSQPLVQYMRSYPRSFFGTQPGKNVISQTSRVFLDLVIRHYPNADVCLQVFEENGNSGLRGWSHSKFSEQELLQFCAYVQAFSSKGSVSFVWDDLSCELGFADGTIVRNEDGGNRFGRTYLSFTFFPDVKLLGDCRVSRDDVNSIKCNYQHLFPELDIRLFNADIGQVGIYEMDRWEAIL